MKFNRSNESGNILALLVAFIFFIGIVVWAVSLLAEASGGYGLDSVLHVFDGIL